MHPNVRSTQFTIVKCWKQPKCPSLHEWIKELVHLYNGKLHSRKKEGGTTLHNSMDETGEHYEVSQAVKDKYHMILPGSGT